MTSYDLDISLKYIFVGLHVLFIAGAAFYINSGQNDFATFFGISSVLALQYYIIYQSGMLQTRAQAQLNLIEQGIQSQNRTFQEGNEKEKKLDLQQKMENRSVSEVEDFIKEKLEEEETLENYGGKTGFLKAVKEAEEEGKDRVTVKYNINEMLLLEENGEVE